MSIAAVASGEKAGRVDIEDLELALSCRLCLGQLTADKVVHEMALKRVLCADLCF